MFKKSILAVSLTATLSACSVNPQIIAPAEVAQSSREDMSLLFRDQAVSGAVSLDEAIARAVLNNREKKLKTLEAALAQGQIEVARHAMLPELTAAAGYSRRSEYAASASVVFDDGKPGPLGENPSYSVSQDKSRHTEDISFTWNVLDFGLSYVRAQQHADRYLISKERERKVVHNITQDVRAAYWRAVSAERLLVKIDPLIEQASDALANSRQVESQRLRAPLEALYYQRELLDILRALQALRLDLSGARTELAGLMGLKPGTAFELADVGNPSFTMPELGVSLNEMEELALQQRPELLESRYQQRISAAEARAALLDMLPGINLTAGVYQDSNDYLLNQDWTSFGAQVSWNLFDVFRVGTERRLAKTREALAEEQRLASSMTVLTQVHLSHIRYQQALKSFDLADSYLQVAQRIGEQTANAASSQRSSELDNIRESLNALLAELRRDVAYADLQNSYGRIFVSMGMDLLPEGYTEVTLEDLSEQIRQRFAAWQAQKTPVAEEAPADDEVDVTQQPAIVAEGKVG
ncbi:TolC family protein [Halopseudomonas salegens]|uniref:Outer membrane protein TolC n=1 Tax=Halopseudomonas salegens TaxID=1434072 RepID=A0A1H2E5L6_9GAMM|nr:TolC family protein [Halopseudomonas salegens]SDT90360.1 Outer membrane protein TolC [Halopseudomonas salegens]